MDTSTITETFTEFFRERGHKRLRGTSLLPPDPEDPVLFVTSGMHPLIPYLQGRPHPQGRRLHNVQRCLRTTDLPEVGDESHLTVFEMLGSWSLGDYSHSQSLPWGWELLTDGYGLDPRRLGVTVFGGDGRCGPDTDSERTWRELGVPESSITFTTDENWWEGPGGMCGPDSELFVWTGDGGPEGDPTTDDRWLELWNFVSMRYRDSGCGLVPLPRPCVDTGMGLERLVMVLQGVDSVYETDLLVPWTRELAGLWGLSGEPLRRVCDHLRSCTVMVSDGVRPSNTGRGYVLRRLVRRVLTELWDTDPDRSLPELDPRVIEHTLTHLGPGGPDEVLGVLSDEQRRFRGLLERGRGLVRRRLRNGPLTESDLRYLHDTHGLPPELVKRLVENLQR